MGWAVGWDTEHRRFRGYGVPAYCDAYSKGCRVEIDRGLGFVCEGFDCGHYDQEDPTAVTIFVCGEHSCADVDEGSLPPEHSDWVAHLLTDKSWETWRAENPERVAEMRAAS